MTLLVSDGVGSRTLIVPWIVEAYSRKPRKRQAQNSVLRTPEKTQPHKNVRSRDQKESSPKRASAQRAESAQG